MMRAILKMLFWFFYSILMILIGVVCAISHVMLGETILLYLTYACAGCVILGIYKIISVRI